MEPFSSPKVFNFWPLLHKGQIFFALTEMIFGQQFWGANRHCVSKSELFRPTETHPAALSYQIRPILHTN